MSRTVNLAAADLGASSGRVMLGRLGAGALELTEVNRFANRPVRVNGTLHWDILDLYAGVLDGLRAAGRGVDRLDGVGVDSWAVDYGLLDASGALLGNPVHYRDSRTDGVMDRVVAAAGAAELYRVSGLQFLAINTIFQLAAAQGDPQFAAARRLLLLPDLLGYWLTGQQAAEMTNASTTGLLDVTTRTWSEDMMRLVSLPAGLLPPLVEPGSRIGELLADVLVSTGLSGPVPVLAVGSHDTASAVVGVPATSERFAYISCGTWSLVGLELDKPVLSDESMAANFTNELGVDGTVRYLRNVMGLWLLQESVRTWNAAGLPADLDTLLHDAGQVPAFTTVIAVDDPVFLPPGDMPARIADHARRTGQTPPQSQAETVRAIVDSLALGHRAALQDAQRLSGHDVDVVHLIGGGSRNELLCQLTADACGLPVEAGPVEASALGNILVQARAVGAGAGDLAGMRALVRATQVIRRYEPSGRTADWAAAAARIDRPTSREPA
ncbi:MAG: rhamnulokinase [Actinomycetota bacterium]|jgi:rhamnulokinase|nr:rhamnulokinase [Actinomycetota bacterium]